MLTSSGDTSSEKRKGLIILHTGEGKGKTTAALGLAFRAVGHGLKVSMIQFIKGRWMTGERLAAPRLAPNFELIPMGKGFTWLSKALEKDKRRASEAWLLSKEKMNSGLYDVVILDEITYPINYNFISLEDVVATLKKKPEKLHVVLTGRNAPPELVGVSDIVSEVRAVKHPYRGGIKAQRGIEF